MERATLEGLVKYSQTSCYLCSEWLDDSVVEEHLLHCRQQTIECSNRCGVVVARKYLHLHLNTCRGSFGDSEIMEGDAYNLAKPEDMSEQLTFTDIISSIENEIRRLKMEVAEIKFNFYKLYHQQNTIASTCDSTNRMGAKLCEQQLDEKKHKELDKKQFRNELNVIRLHLANLQHRINNSNINETHTASTAAARESVMREQMAILEKQNNWFRSQLETNKRYANILENRIIEFESGSSLTSTNGHIIWRITNVAKLMAESSQQPSILLGPIFTNAPYGYKLLLTANLNGCGRWLGHFMTLSLVCQSGPFDNLLQWPCRLTAKVILRGQPQANSEIVAPDYKRTILMTKPKEIEKCEQLVEIPHMVLFSPRYLQNDTVFLEIMVFTGGNPRRNVSRLFSTS